MKLPFLFLASAVLLSANGPLGDDGEVTIPAGNVVTGDYPSGYGNYPPQVVFVPEFAIEKYEVTNERFAEFVDAGGYHKKEYWIISGSEDSLRGWNWKERNGIQCPKYWEVTAKPYWKTDSYSPGADTPVVGVSWFEAMAYARWAGKRLPSAVEWEKAARGSSSQFGTYQNAGVGVKYPWGNDFFHRQAPPEYRLCNWRLRYYAYRYPDTDGRASRTGYPVKSWTTDGYRESAAPVGTFSPQGDSPYGVSDMAGNVWEWTATGYPGYEQSLVIIKGGGWYKSTLDHLKTGYIHGMGPYLRGRNIGFRCARSSP